MYKAHKAKKAKNNSKNKSKKALACRFANTLAAGRGKGQCEPAILVMATY